MPAIDARLAAGDVRLECDESDRRTSRVLYDTDNPDGPDHDFYRRLADEVAPDVVVDLDCGTLILTVTLAATGRTLIGIDPDAEMLDVARSREGSDAVRWILGDSRDLVDSHAGLVLMTGNVAQHLGPVAWPRALADISAGLRLGGVVSFETRNPSVEAWRTWAEAGGQTTRDTPHGPLTEWEEVAEPDVHGTVVLTSHNLWADTGEEIVVTLPLTFRSVHQLSADLDHAGLTLLDLYGGWLGEPFTQNSHLIVIVATRAS